MREWIETSYVTIVFDYELEDRRKENFFGFKNKNIDNYFINVPSNTYSEKLEWARNYILANQYEIKAVMPLTQGMGITEVQPKGPWAYSTAFTTIIGYTILLQRKVMIEDAEYDKRITKYENIKIKTKLEARLPQLEKDFNEVSKLGREVVVEKKFLGTTYMVGVTPYGNEAEANKKAAENAAKYNKIKKELDEAREELETANKILNSLE